MRARRAIPGSALIATFGAALAAACGDGAPSATSSSASTSPGTTAAPSASAAPTAASRPFAVTSGQALALSAGGETVFVAGEDQLAVFAVPASLRDPAATRVIPVPGPPAQIVASAGLVLVTVRTLPDAGARSAYEALRGKEPQPAAVTRLPSAKATPAPAIDNWRGTHLRTETQYRPMLDPSLDALPDNDIFTPGIPKPGQRRGAPPAASAGPSATASAGPATTPSARKDKPSPREKAPPKVPLDPGTLRRSQGGLLLAFRPDPERGLVEIGRTVVAPDAWGVGVTPDGKRAVVTSAWSAEVSVIDLDSKQIVFRSRVPREPRGVAISGDGKTAWVSHLAGTDLTRIQGLDGTPVVASQPLPAAPARTPVGATLSASLGYSLVLSPDGRDLFAPRHAIGAEGVASWWGVPTIDVLDIPAGRSRAPARSPGSPSAVVPLNDIVLRAPSDWEAQPGQAPGQQGALTQPRAAVYREKTDTLLVASEGWDSLAEVDALAADPSMAVIRTYDLAVLYDAFGHFPPRGGAPSAVVLSADEDTAYVYCRTTFDVVKVHLPSRRTDWLRLAEDTLPPGASRGRRLFASARSDRLSGGLACAGCHPEGRDDGYVWREGAFEVVNDHARRFIALRANAKTRHTSFGPDAEKPKPVKLYPRQTPMIAGRVRAGGPYGWHAESATLADRIQAGFELHRGAWESDEMIKQDGSTLAMVDYLMDYLRSGLPPPPTIVRELTPLEARGKAIFESDAAKCASCHKPETEHTDRTAYPLPALPVRFGFDAEENSSFKTPTLRFIAGTAPYFHDGSAATLEELVAKNGNRMGATLALSADDRAALVAYLETL